MALEDTLKGFFDQIKSRLVIPMNTQHTVLGTRRNVFTTDPIVKEIGIVESEDELDRQRGYRESFRDVFNNWTRISRQVGIEGDQANPDELDAWVYDGDNVLRCTQNTASLVGFISPTYYDDFTLEVKLSSTDGDDDFIGICVAYALDRDGTTHTLTVMRQLNGLAPLLIEVDRDEFHGDTSTYQKAIYNGLLWSEGVEATDKAESEETPGWSESPEGVMLKVVRKGDNLTVETSQFNSLDYFEPAKTTINLNDDPELERFKGPKQFGYVCLSQRDSTWEVFRRPGEEKLSIVDARDYTLSKFVDGQWVDTPSDLESLVDSGELIKGRMHLNLATGKFYYLGEDNDLSRF